MSPQSIGTAPLRWTLAALVCAIAFADPSTAAAQAPPEAAKIDSPPPPGLPDWVKEVGAKTTPPVGKTFAVKDYGAVADGATTATESIQKAIDACTEAGGGAVTFEKGTYLSGAIFLKNNVELKVDKGVTLLGTQNEAHYPRIPTRVAGIEMTWPSAFINVNDAHNVKISGDGTIDGNGQVWWVEYWWLRDHNLFGMQNAPAAEQVAMLAQVKANLNPWARAHSAQSYQEQGIRWASDYDADRVRLCVIKNSKDVTLEEVHLRRSGFWTVQVLYSNQVTVDGITIRDNQGPSTDGIDIDSSSHVLVQNNDIDNNDDDICLKSGRDWDGQRVDRPVEYIVVADNTTRRGGGLLGMGSETAGGIQHIVAYGNHGIGTNEGIRFKSYRTRGGTYEDIQIYNTVMENLPRPITFTLNWNPSYSDTPIPAGMTEMPNYWKALSHPIEPPEKGIPHVKGVIIKGMKITGAQTWLTAEGLPQSLLEDVHFEDIDASSAAPGNVSYAKNWTMKNVVVKTQSGDPMTILNSEDVESPKAEADPNAPAARGRGGRGGARGGRAGGRRGAAAGTASTTATQNTGPAAAQ